MNKPTRLSLHSREETCFVETCDPFFETWPDRIFVERRREMLLEKKKEERKLIIIIIKKIKKRRSKSTYDKLWCTIYVIREILSCYWKLQLRVTLPVNQISRALAVDFMLVKDPWMGSIWWKKKKIFRGNIFLPV